MKFRYYIRGFGAGLIVATAVLLIAGMIERIIITLFLIIKRRKAVVLL